MEPGLDKSIEDALAAAPASEGPRSVRIDLDDLTRIVRRAIDDSYSGGSGRGVLEYQVEDRLGALLEAHDRIQSLRTRLDDHRQHVQQALSQLRAALVSRRGFVEDLSRPMVWPVDPERWHTLRMRVQARLAAFADSKTKDAASPRLLTSELLELFLKERASSLADLRRQSDLELTQLERNLTQLLTTLEGADEALAVLRDMPAVDTGLSSGYRDVQGLDEEARFRERKIEMLAQIYRANQKLQAPLLSPPEAGAE